jgi:hypothetical protein
VSFIVSPDRVAERMAGDDEAADGAGHDADASPEVVQLRATGLAVACAAGVGGVVAPHAQRSVRARTGSTRCIVFLWNAAPTG